MGRPTGASSPYGLAASALQAGVTEEMDLSLHEMPRSAQAVGPDRDGLVPQVLPCCFR